MESSPSSDSKLSPNQHNRYGQDAALAGSGAVAAGAAGAAYGGNQRAEQAVASESSPATTQDHHEGYAHVQGTT